MSADAPVQGLGTVVLGNRRLGGADLERRVRQAARVLVDLGLEAGDCVAILTRNDLPFFEATLAAQWLGIYPVPVNWHFAPAEIAYVIADSGAKVLVAHADILAAVGREVAGAARILACATPADIAKDYGLDPAIGVVPPDLEDWDRAVDRAAPLEAPALPAPASMIYTSGTTGKPKGVRRFPPTPEQAAATLPARRHVFGFRPGMRAVMTGPLYHSAPNLYALFTLRFGGTLHLMPRFDARAFLDIVAREGITHAHMVPTMFVRLWRLPDAVKAAADTRSLEWIAHGAAPCPPDIKRHMIDWWGPVIHEYYGGTETGAAVHCGPQDWLSHPGTVGRAIPGAKVEILDDRGEPLGPGEIGEVYLRLSSFPDFTYHGRDADRAAVERRGLITCGDIGYLDADGFLYLCDRKRDMVISGGVNIYPAEIEHVLIEMPGVRDCAVFGIPDDEFGEALAAAVQAEPGVTEAAVKAHLAARVARYKVPRIVTFHDALPREDSGKIFKRRLREPYWAKAGRHI